MRDDTAPERNRALRTPSRAAATTVPWSHGRDASKVPLGDRTAFLLEFLRQPRQIGSVVPSSRQLEQRIVRTAQVARARTLVELGPGTGGTTRAILRAMQADARLLAIDLSPAFCARLAASVNDARLIVHQGSAEAIEALVAAHHLPHPDVIVSGIPFSTLPADVADRIAAAIARVLAPGGRFVAYQVRAQVAEIVSPHLGAPARQWEYVNIPPVRLFTWIQKAT